MDSEPQRIAIFGATSGIAEAAARIWAGRGARLVLFARNAERLEAVRDDLEVRGAAGIVTLEADFADGAALPALVERAWAAFGGLDVALVAYGALPDQPATQQDPAALERALRLNFESPAILCSLLAAKMEAAHSGTIAAITSVAGDRGRASNYAYGAAKGGLQRFLEGLRHRLHAASVQVVDIRPGLVATAMTAHLDPSGPLWAQPGPVGRAIVAAIDRGRPVVYAPLVWRGIMAIVRNLPRRIMHRTRF